MPPMPVSRRATRCDAIPTNPRGLSRHGCPPLRQARQQWGTENPRTDLKRRSGKRESLEAFGELPLSDKIRKFRRRTASGLVSIGVLAGINLAFSPQFPWFLFPAAAMAIGWLQRAASLWADGVRFTDIFGARAVEKLANEPEYIGRSPAVAGRIRVRSLHRLDVLAGPHGSVVRRAANDQHAIREAMDKLTKADRDLIPDVLPTVVALAERVGSVALSLHRLDEDIRPALSKRPRTGSPPGPSPSQKSGSGKSNCSSASRK